MQGGAIGVLDDSFYFVLSLADRDRPNERSGKEKEGERERLDRKSGVQFLRPCSLIPLLRLDGPGEMKSVMPFYEPRPAPFLPPLSAIILQRREPSVSSYFCR